MSAVCNMCCYSLWHPELNTDKNKMQRMCIIRWVISDFISNSMGIYTKPYKSCSVAV
jgi:hypothetical protein